MNDIKNIFSTPPKKTTVYAVGAILLLLNVVLKLLFITQADISHDEPFTIFHAQFSIPELLGIFEQENNPPLHFLLLHYWIKIFGTGAFSVRFLSCLFSCLTVLYIYGIGIKFFNLRTAILAVIIFTFSNEHLYHAHEARAYSLMCFLTAGSMFYFLSLLKEPEKKINILLLILFNALLIYGHFFGLFVLFLQGVSCLLFKELRAKILRTYIYAALITFVLYIPYLRIFIIRLTQSAGNGTWVEKPEVNDLYGQLIHFSNQSFNALVFIIIIFSFLLWIIFRKKTIDSYEKIIITWFFLPYLTMFLVSYKVPMFMDRYILYISLGFYLSVAIAINHINIKIAYYMIFITILISMLKTFNPAAHIDRKPALLVKNIKAMKTASTLIYITPPWVDLQIVYHYNIDYFKDYKHTRELLNKDHIFPVYNISGVDTLAMKKASDIIFIDEWADLTDPNHTLYNTFLMNFPHVTKDDRYGAYILYHFSK